MIRDTWRIVRLGLKSLLLHKLRSALTTAGILFGVASVIAMLAVGEGAKQDALERFRAIRLVTPIAWNHPRQTAHNASASSNCDTGANSRNLHGITRLWNPLVPFRPAF